MAIPIMTLAMATAILLNIAIFREITVFIYLSFVPGFVLLKIFNLREVSFLKTFLFSIGLSIAFSMFVGLVVSELYSILGFSQPLSAIPLTTIVSALTLIMFFIGYRHDLSASFVYFGDLNKKFKASLPILIVLILLPLLGVVSALFVDVPLMLLLFAIIAVLCVLTFTSKRLVFSSFSPFLVFSVSIAILCLSMLLSKYVIGYDSNIEYYVFRTTLISGSWAPLSIRAFTWAPLAINFHSMLSVTVLPSIYSVMMNVNGELVFKLLYIFAFSTVPLALYEIYERQIGKPLAVISALFFVFTSVAFFAEPVSLNRQIIGTVFFLLSISALLDNKLPTAKKRFFLIIFGAALVVSHYSLAYILLILVGVLFVRSRMKSTRGVLDAVSAMLIFVLTFSWYAFCSNNMTLLAGSIERILSQGLIGQISAQAGTAAAVFPVPEVFTIASWINMGVNGLANLLLIVGVVVVIFRSKSVGLSEQYRLLVIMTAVIMAVALAAPNIASILNFSRVYGITLLFLSPCFAIGGVAILTTIRSKLVKIKSPKLQLKLRNSYSKGMFLLIACLLSAYFLSQSGFVNYVTGSKIHSVTIDYHRMQKDTPQNAAHFYSTYIPEQDVSSAIWLSKYFDVSSLVYADSISRPNVLTSYGLIPAENKLALLNVSSPESNSFIYLGSLNILRDLIPVSYGTLNSSDISLLIETSNLIYSNGNSEIRRINGLD